MASFHQDSWQSQKKRPGKLRPTRGRNRAARNKRNAAARQSRIRNR